MNGGHERSSTVTFADQFEGYGNLVIVDHGARACSLYGYLGATAASTSTPGLRAGRNPAVNPALHFDLRVDGAASIPYNG